MTLSGALYVVRSFEQEHIPYWLVGGFAVELAVGREVRPHDDVDFFIPADHAERAVDVLAKGEFERVHGSLEGGDVFYKRGDVVVDLVPIHPADPPRTVGELGRIAWPAGFLSPYRVLYKG